MNQEQQARRLQTLLDLDGPPIGLSRVQEQPEGLTNYQGEVPSACTFWRTAETGMFYASAAHHANCPIGMMTMGFGLPEAVQEQLQLLVEKMASLGYVAGDEPGSIPAFNGDASGIVYGPLAEYPGPPALVLLWLTPRQAMVFGEASERLRWTASSPMTVHGRPGCAALPLALASGQPTLSLGCAGLRTFTEVADDRMLGVVPGSILESFVAGLSDIVNANETMNAFYAERKAALKT